MNAAVVNLCFHGVGTPRRDLEPGEAEYWISERTFLDVLDLVEGRDDVRLSFDDGNLSDATVGLPALAARGLHAEFFVIAGRIGESGSLGPEEIGLLVASGMSIGSHGMHHRSWRETPAHELDRELGEARDLLASVAGGPVHTAACPLGAYDRRVLAELRRRGYTRVMTSDRAAARRDRWLQPRFSLRRVDDAQSVSAILSEAPRLQRWRSEARMLAKRIR